jgi:hypothetical protein
MASFDVDDGETPRGEADSGVEERPVVVRPPMSEGAGHRLEDGSIGFRGGNGIEGAADAAHARMDYEAYRMT